MTCFNFDHSYAKLPDVFYKFQNPTPVRDPKLVIFNNSLAQKLGLELAGISEKELVESLAGNGILPQSKPIAQAYNGHQFGHLSRLGDGRALLLGEHVLSEQDRVDIQLKGSGPTPFSRQGDGRAALGPMLREYLISEAMHGLGIATTRSLAVVTTGELVYRDKPLPGAILTRVAQSYIRIGTFEYAALLEDKTHLKTLADYTIQRHYPHLQNSKQLYADFLEAVIHRQASLVAKWMLVGFVHGVLNTDNTSIAGETIDYGPCAFMDIYDDGTVFSSIDQFGRYAYDQQAPIINWNLARFAETLLPLLHTHEQEALTIATEKINAFADQFAASYFSGMKQKLGLFNLEDADPFLIDDFFTLLKSQKQDYTTSFHHLLMDQPVGCFQSDQGQVWLEKWKTRLNRQPQSWAQVVESMEKINPWVIPRNSAVESALQNAEAGNFEPFFALLKVIQNPFSLSARTSDYVSPGPKLERPYRTFCGT